MGLRSLLPPRFRLLSRDDATALAFIANGGDGCISLISNVAPDLCQAIFSSCGQGRLQTARYLQSRLAPLTTSLTKESPAALKYALCLLGFMSPTTRLPIVDWTKQQRPRSRARSRRSATRIWPVRAKAGATLAATTVSPLPIDLRGSSYFRAVE
jgi:dihydrodipicolinate synthase/N-acetylneuraminate lyase